VPFVPHCQHQHLVHAPAPQAHQVKGDEQKPDFPEALDEGGPKFWVKEAGEVFRWDFNPRNCFVVADPEGSETVLAQKVLRLFNLPQLFGRNWRTVRETGSKAGEGRFVPSGQTQPTGEAANFAFGETQFGEGRNRSLLFRSLHPRAKIVQVVGNRTVNDVAETEFLGKGLQLAEQVRLAKVAPVGRV